MSAVVRNVTQLQDVQSRSVSLPQQPEQEFRPVIVSESSDDDLPEAKTLDEFQRPLPNDAQELLKNRFLCRRGGLLLVGPTGIAKSSLSMQMMIGWALGKKVLGVEPARPLKSLLIQAENDDGDLAEMRDGMFSGLNVSDKEREEACSRIYITTESSRVSEEFFQETVRPLLQEIKPDLLWIDPALAYLGGDSNSQQEVGRFLRNQLNPVLADYNCAAVIVHHTNKPYAGNERKGPVDFAYLGGGSAEWANWSRAIITLQRTDKANIFELRAAKRGSRLAWKEADGSTTAYSRFIGHHKEPGTICWVDVDLGAVEELSPGTGKARKTTDDVLKHVPQNRPIAKNWLIDICSRDGIGQNATRTLIDELVESKTLYLWQKPREANRPELYLARIPQPLDSNGRVVFTEVFTAVLTHENPHENGLHSHTPPLGGCEDRREDVKTACKDQRVDLLPVAETNPSEDRPPSPPLEVIQSIKAQLPNIQPAGRLNSEQLT